MIFNDDIHMAIYNLSNLLHALADKPVLGCEV